MIKFGILVSSVLALALGIGVACKGPKETASKSEEKKTSLAQTSQQPEPEAAIGLNLGNQAPDISMMNPKDSVLRLSSLRGKIVLVDFWASWCGPCRAENPTVVKAYAAYHQKKLKSANGFEIFSVSLDRAKGPWRDAIVKDGLVWPYHVCDLLGWDNAAAMQYKVTSIPTNFLLNEKGIIIARVLRGEDLIRTLEQMVQK